MRWQGPAGGPPARWPAWFAPLAFLIAFGASLLATGLMYAGAAVAGNDVRPGNATITIASLIAQDSAFIVVAMLFAFRTWPVAMRDLGLKPLPWRPALGWTIAAIGGWYAFTLLYAAILSPDGQQDALDTLDTLTANHATGLLITVTLLIVLVAPVAEEIFFRGFCYRALRNRFSRWGAAALIGTVFGGIHYTGPDTLPVILPLAVFGALLCLIYERTGSLYPSIALHIVNNAIAVGVGTGTTLGVVIAGTAAAVGLAGCGALGLARSRPTSAGET